MGTQQIGYRKVQVDPKDEPKVIDGMAKKMRDEFKDLEEFSEESLKRLWLNKHDEIWNQYLKR